MAGLVAATSVVTNVMCMVWHENPGSPLPVVGHLILSEPRVSVTWVQGHLFAR